MTLVHSPAAHTQPGAEPVVLARVTPNEAAVLNFIGPDGGDDDWKAYPFAPIARETGLDRRLVRLACRRLARRGLAAFERALWTEDGDMIGAGYRATNAGRHWYWSRAQEATTAPEAGAVGTTEGREPQSPTTREGADR